MGFAHPRTEHLTDSCLSRRELLADRADLVSVGRGGRAVRGDIGEPPGPQHQGVTPAGDDDGNAGGPVAAM